MARIEIDHRRQTRPPAPVRINGVEISRDAIGNEAQHHPAANAAEARKAAARALAIRELLLQEARRLDIVWTVASDRKGRRETEEEAMIRALLEREVVVCDPDEASLRRYFENNRVRFRAPDLFTVAHVLIAADPDDSAARQSAQVAAKALARALIQSGQPAAFEEAARTRSACPSAAQGGALGQIGRGQTAPEFEAALACMVEGKIHPEPVETRYGFHVVRLDRRIAGRELPFELVHDRIAAYLADCAERIALGHYIRMLARRAQVEGIDLAPASTPLIQ